MSSGCCPSKLTQQRDNSISMCASTTEAWKCVPPGNGTVRRDPSLTGTPGYDSKSRSAYEYQQRLQEAATNRKRGSSTSTVRIKQQRAQSSENEHQQDQRTQGSFKHNGRGARFKRKRKHSSHQAATDSRVRRTSISTINGHKVC